MATEHEMTDMTSAEIAAELRHLRELMSKAEQREADRQQKLRPIVGWMRIMVFFLLLVGVGLLLAEWTYGFKGHMAAAVNQFVLLGSLMAMVFLAFVPLTGRSYGIVIRRPKPQRAD